LGIDVAGLPERHGQLRVGIELLRQHPDVAVFDAELIVAAAPLGVLLPHRLVAERLELLERFIERHDRDSTRVSTCGSNSNGITTTAQQPAHAG